MPRLCYNETKFKPNSTFIILKAIQILKEYAADGYDLTLRQLYYQFVARGLTANKDSEYKRLGAIVNKARMSGYIDWNYIVDRTRHLRKLAHWDSPEEILESCASQFRLDKWADQPNHVEVWIEKDALVGVIEGICDQLDVPYFSCRGYTSQSEMWRAGRRLLACREAGQDPHILHLGDHDPSGIDMTRDIEDRLWTFSEGRVQVHRIALTMDQVEEINPPPNPAKLTDSRARDYVVRYGDESWELDALSPQYISNLIENEVGYLRDEDLWGDAVEAEGEHKRRLSLAATNFSSLKLEAPEPPPKPKKKVAKKKVAKKKVAKKKVAKKKASKKRGSKR